MFKKNITIQFFFQRNADEIRDNDSYDLIDLCSG